MLVFVVPTLLFDLVTKLGVLIQPSSDLIICGMAYETHSDPGGPSTGWALELGQTLAPMARMLTEAWDMFGRRFRHPGDPGGRRG